MNEKRLGQLQRLLAENNLDAAAIMPGPNMVYYSGIHAHLSERPIVLFVPADEKPAIIIPTLEAMKASAANISSRRIFDWNDDDGYAGAFGSAAAVLDLNHSTLGVEALHMRVLESQLLRASASGLTIAPADDLIGAGRLQKDEQEIAAIERAVAAAEAAMTALLPQIRPGISEKQIAAMLTQELLDAGAEAVSFSPIVATGPNTAIPHAVPTDRQLQYGDLLLFDWGALIDGYSSDITRTYAVGKLEPELRTIHETVRLANEAAKAVIGPGVPAREVDRAARKVIEQAGYGPYFFHRTGHGLGLEVHEQPNMLESNEIPLQVGNVFTVEPGIYLEGRGGVRIEDNVLVTTKGSRSLTSLPRELIIVG